MDSIVAFRFDFVGLLFKKRDKTRNGMEEVEQVDELGASGMTWVVWNTRAGKELAAWGGTEERRNGGTE